MPSLVAGHQSLYGDERHRFLTLDLRVDALPAADVLLCLNRVADLDR